MGAPQQMPGAPGDPAAMGLPMATPNQEFTSMISSRLNNSQNMQANGTASIDLTALASMHAQQLAKLDPVDQQVGIQNLRAQSPELADMVIQLLKKMTGGNAQAGGQPGGQTGVDMRPLPEQRAPRRATGIV